MDDLMWTVNTGVKVEQLLCFHAGFMSSKEAQDSALYSRCSFCTTLWSIHVDPSAHKCFEIASCSRAHKG
ncbi:hypothetical protein BT69DRAFT_1284254 [Atractiella rhizophila]|nr:hypothetical protein BT69DRAFT_1284254 [Atractiella rhizophila]